MPTTVDIESQRMLLGTTPVRKIYHGANLIGTRIAELFAGGVPGVWFDPSDLSTLYQDAAGTLPVTGVEQPVGLMLDKSGRGNHISQSTTTARPILRTTSVGGTQQYYLDFDGVDDFMSTASTANFSTTSELAAMVAVYVPPEQTARGTLLELGTSYANPGCVGMEAPMFTATAVGMGYRGSGVESARSVSASKNPIGTVVFGGTLDLNAPLVQLRVNSLNKQQSTISAGPGPFANATLFLGARNGNNQRFKGRLYGAVLCGKRVLSPELNSLEQFLRNKSRAY